MIIKQISHIRDETGRRHRSIPDEILELLTKTYYCPDIIKYFNCCSGCIRGLDLPHCSNCDWHHPENLTYCSEHKRCYRGNTHCWNCGAHHGNDRIPCKKCSVCTSHHSPHCDICNFHHHESEIHCFMCVEKRTFVTGHCFICGNHCRHPNKMDEHYSCCRCGKLIRKSEVHRICSQCHNCFSSFVEGKCPECSERRIIKKTKRIWCNICNDFKGKCRWIVNLPENHYQCLNSSCKICTVSHCKICNHCHGLLDLCVKN